MHSYSPSCYRGILSRLERHLRCLTSCRFGINLTSHVSSIKEHPVMTSSTVALWWLKSRSWLKPISCFSKVEFVRASYSTAGLYYLLLWHMERVAAIGSLWCSFYYSFVQIMFVCLFYTFQKNLFVPPETKVNLCRAFCFMNCHHQ